MHPRTSGEYNSTDIKREKSVEVQFLLHSEGHIPRVFAIVIANPPITAETNEVINRGIERLR
jgi:hypothetical protein